MDSLSIDTLVNGQNMPGKLLNLNRIMVNRYLDELADDNYLTVNRTAGLDMVYLEQLEVQTVLEKHYQKGSPCTN